MKCVIVKASTIAKYRRMDAEFYTGHAEHKTFDKVIAERKKAVRRARVRLATARRDKKAAEDRIAALIAAGEIVPVSIGKK